MIERQNIPNEPGVYLFKDEKGEIIYVGKARNLRSRVSSYFSGKDHSPKTQHLVKHIRDHQFIIVDNEVEALLLENRLIKKHWPRYNIALKDSKTFAYLLMTDEKFPRLLTVRKPGKKGTYFGPYVDGGLRHELSELATRLYKLRTCTTLPKKACLNYHIGLCTAPCIGAATPTQYLLQVEGAKKLLSGKTEETVKQLEREMQRASAELKFEVALEKKRHLEAISHLQERQKVDLVKRIDQDIVALVKQESMAIIELLSIKRGVLMAKKEFKFEYEPEVFGNFIKMYYSQRQIPSEIIVNQAFWADEAEREALEGYLGALHQGIVALTLPIRGEKLELVKLAEKNAQVSSESRALTELKDALNLSDVPSTIECFDISNLGSEHVVAAMTQWVNGKPNKSGYRKFLIRGQSAQDDFAAMAEAVLRRYSRLVAEKESLPNLIIIDGGLGQLNAALGSLGKLGLQIPIFALAKENEEIYLPGSSEPLRYPKSGRMMLLVRAIRDSVHKFVLNYNRKRREMKMRDEFEK